MLRYLVYENKEVNLGKVEVDDVKELIDFRNSEISPSSVTIIVNSKEVNELGECIVKINMKITHGMITHFTNLGQSVLYYMGSKLEKMSADEIFKVISNNSEFISLFTK